MPPIPSTYFLLSSDQSLPSPRLHHLEIFKRGISTTAKPGLPHRSGMDIEQGDVVPGIDDQLVIDFAGTGDVLAAGLPSHFSAAR